MLSIINNQKNQNHSKLLSFKMLTYYYKKDHKKVCQDKRMMENRVRMYIPVIINGTYIPKV